MRPRLLDLYCCAGGASAGYVRAGFDVVGVDIDPQPHYPFEFVQADALTYLADHGHEFDAVHASPPCQLFTGLATLSIAKGRRKAPPDLLAPTRDALIGLGKPYVIENVPGAPMADYVTLCGSEFGLRALDVDGAPLQLRRHRQFESNVWLTGAGGCQHRPDIQTASVFGHGGGLTPEQRATFPGGYVPHKAVCARLLDIDWPMSKRELSESIPPAYTAFIGAQLLDPL